MLAQQQPAILVDLILELSANDYLLQENLIARFAATQVGNESKLQSIDQLLEHIKQEALGIDQFHYKAGEYFADCFEHAFLQLDAAIKSGRYSFAIELSFALIELIQKYGRVLDDSNGDVGGLYEDAFSRLTSACPPLLPQHLRSETFHLLLEKITNDREPHWTWGFDKMQLAGTLASSAAEALLLRETIERRDFDNYEQEQICDLIISLLRKHESEASVTAYEQQYEHVDSVCKRLIERAFAKTDYAEANRLVNQALTPLSATAPTLSGRRDQWAEWRLRIAVAQEDKPTIVLLARAAVLEGNYRFNPDPFTTLKAEIPSTIWPNYFQELIRDLSVGKVFYPNRVALELLVREQCWDQLLAMLLVRPNLNQLNEYADKFPGKYHSDFAAAMIALLDDYIDQNASQGAYCEGVKILQRIAVLGDPEGASTLAAGWRGRYKRRKTMLAILDAAGF